MPSICVKMHGFCCFACKVTCVHFQPTTSEQRSFLMYSDPVLRANWRRTQPPQGDKRRTRPMLKWQTLFHSTNRTQRIWTELVYCEWLSVTSNAEIQCQKMETRMETWLWSLANIRRKNWFLNVSGCGRVCKWVWQSV